LNAKRQKRTRKQRGGVLWTTWADARKYIPEKKWDFWNQFFKTDARQFPQANLSIEQRNLELTQEEQEKLIYSPYFLTNLVCSDIIPKEQLQQIFKGSAYLAAIESARKNYKKLVAENKFSFEYIPSKVLSMFHILDTNFFNTYTKLTNPIEILASLLKTSHDDFKRSNDIFVTAPDKEYLFTFSKNPVFIDNFKDIIKINPYFFDPVCLFIQAAYFAWPYFYWYVFNFEPWGFIQHKLGDPDSKDNPNIIVIKKEDLVISMTRSYKLVTSENIEKPYDSIVFAVTYLFCLYSETNGYSGVSVVEVRQYSSWKDYTMQKTPTLLRERSLETLEKFRSKSTFVNTKKIINQPFGEYAAIIKETSFKLREIKEKKPNLIIYFLEDFFKFLKNFNMDYKSAFIQKKLDKWNELKDIFSTLSDFNITSEEMAFEIDKANLATFNGLQNIFEFNKEKSVILFLTNFLSNFKDSISLQKEKWQPILNLWPRLYHTIFPVPPTSPFPRPPTTIAPPIPPSTPPPVQSTTIPRPSVTPPPPQFPGFQPPAGGRRTYRKCRNQRKRLTF